MKNKSQFLTAMALFFPLGLFAQNPHFMKNINLNAPVKCSREILIKASSYKVWKVLTAIDQWSQWQKDIHDSHITGELKPGIDFTWKTGGARIHSTLHTVKPYSEFGWTGKTMGMFAIHNWTLTETQGDTRVQVEESMQGLWASLFHKSFNKNLQKGMESWLQQLKTQVERN